MVELIGYWNDGRHGLLSTWIHPDELSGYEWSAGDKECVLNYLRSGVMIMQELGYSWCRCDPSIPDSEMGTMTMSDGVWAWPEGLAFYVDRFDIELPSIFLDHARSQNYELPGRLHVLEKFDAELSCKFWNEWCKEHSEK